MGVFCLVVGLPMWFLLFIEFMKLCEKNKEPDLFDNILKESKNKKDNKKPAFELKEGEDDNYAPLLPDKNKDEEDNNNLGGDNNIINNSNLDDDNNILVNEDVNNIIPEGEMKPSIIPNDNENNNILDN